MDIYHSAHSGKKFNKSEEQSDEQSNKQCF